MLKTFTAVVLAASVSAECYRPHDFPNEIANKIKITHGKDYKPQCAILNNKLCR